MCLLYSLMNVMGPGNGDGDDLSGGSPGKDHYRDDDCG